MDEIYTPFNISPFPSRSTVVWGEAAHYRNPTFNITLIEVDIGSRAEMGAALEAVSDALSVPVSNPDALGSLSWSPRFQVDGHNLIVINNWQEFSRSKPVEFALFISELGNSAHSFRIDGQSVVILIQNEDKSSY